VKSAPSPLAPAIEGALFTRRDGRLLIGGLAVDELADRFGTPLYLYDAALIRRRLGELRAALPWCDVFYSLKCNPNPSVVQLLLSAGCGLEIASAGELELALASGAPARRVLFAGPGKTEAELELAVARGLLEIHVESRGEIERLGRIAARQGRPTRVALRINPAAAVAGGSAQQMGGGATAFGIDEAELEAAVADVQRHPSLQLHGLHVFSGTQSLQASGFGLTYALILDIARRIVARCGHPLATIDFGGGFGVPYFPGDEPLDLLALHQAVSPVLQPLGTDPCFRGTRLVIEPGRFLTAEAGLFVASVTDTKRCRGLNFAVLDGGLAQHLPASGQLGQIIKRNFPIVVSDQNRPRPEIVQELAGPLCTPLDIIGRAVRLPELRPGDRIAVLQSGSYARTCSPMSFLGHPEPPEVMVEAGEAQLIRARSTSRDLFARTCLDPNSSPGTTMEGASVALSQKIPA
jgi:diaminopimelate decarboxylase